MELLSNWTFLYGGQNRDALHVAPTRRDIYASLAIPAENNALLNTAGGGRARISHLRPRAVVGWNGTAGCSLTLTRPSHTAAEMLWVNVGEGGPTGVSRIHSSAF
jgi:hypothetical protein